MVNSGSQLVVVNNQLDVLQPLESYHAVPKIFVFFLLGYGLLFIEVLLQVGRFW